MLYRRSALVLRTVIDGSFVCMFPIEKAYSVDESQLASMEAKYTLLSEQLDQLETEEHMVGYIDVCTFIEL